MQYNRIQYNFIVPVGKFLRQQYEHGGVSYVTKT